MSPALSSPLPGFGEMEFAPIDVERCVIVDLDGTLSNPKSRIHLVTGTKKKDWDQFFKEAINDPAHHWCVHLVRTLYLCGYDVSIVTARPERCLDDTLAWLEKYGVTYDTIFMRKDGDRRPDHVVKKAIFLEHLQGKNIEFVIDDREEVVKMWRGLGLQCLQPNPHDFN